MNFQNEFIELMQKYDVIFDVSRLTISGNLEVSFFAADSPYGIILVEHYAREFNIVMDSIKPDNTL